MRVGVVQRRRLRLDVVLVRAGCHRCPGVRLRGGVDGRVASVTQLCLDHRDRWTDYAPRRTRRAIERFKGENPGHGPLGTVPANTDTAELCAKEVDGGLVFDGDRVWVHHQLVNLTLKRSTRAVEGQGSGGPGAGGGPRHGVPGAEKSSAAMDEVGRITDELDAPGKRGAEVGRRVQDVLDAGYTIRIVTVDVPQEVARERGDVRSVVGGRAPTPLDDYYGPDGSSLPVAVHHAVCEEFAQYVASGRLQAVVLDNDVPFGEAPVVVDRTPATG